MANEVSIRVTAEDRASGPLRDINSAAVGLGVAFGVLAAQAAASLAGMGRDAIAVGISFNAMKEQAQIAFTTMLGSGEKAKRFLDDLQAFAAKTPFEFPDLLKSAQRLKAMGFEAEQVIPLMTNIGDAVSGLGGGAAEINRVVIALGQMQSRGKTTAQEMNQLTEVGIPAWKFLSEAIGKPIPEAMKLVEKGAIDARTTITAVTQGMNRDFGGMMEQQSKTWNGMISTIKDNARIVAGEVAGPLFEQLKGTMAGFMTWFEQNRAQIAETATKIGQAIAAIADVVSDTVEMIVKHWGTIGPALQMAWNASGAAAIVAVITSLNEMRDNWRFAANDIISIVEDMVNKVVDGLNIMIGAINKIPLLDDIGAIGKANLGRFNAWSSPEEADNAPRGAILPAAAKGAKGAIADLSGWVGAGTSKATGATAVDPLTVAIKAIQDRFNKELAKALVEGGERAFQDLQAQQEQIRAEIGRTADDLMVRLGVDLPTALGLAADAVISASDAIQAAGDATQKRFNRDLAEALLDKKGGMDKYNKTLAEQGPLFARIAQSAQQLMKVMGIQFPEAYSLATDVILAGVDKLKDTVRNDLQGFLGKLGARRSAIGLNAIEGFNVRPGVGGGGGQGINITRHIGTLIVSGTATQQDVVNGIEATDAPLLRQVRQSFAAAR